MPQGSKFNLVRDTVTTFKLLLDRSLFFVSLELALQKKKEEYSKKRDGEIQVKAD